MELYVKQERAAYITPQIKAAIEAQSEAEQRQIEALYRYASLFELITNFQLEDVPAQSNAYRLSKVAKNIVQRGFPTLASQVITRIYDRVLNQHTSDSKEEEVDIKSIKQSLIFYDPDFRFSQGRRYYQKNVDGTLTSAEINNTEAKFLRIIDNLPSINSRNNCHINCSKNTPNELSNNCEINHIIAQQLRLQHNVETVINCPNTHIERFASYVRFCLGQGKAELLNHFAKQRLDFTLILPELDSKEPHCLNIELDGPQHEELTQKVKDKERDALLADLQWAGTLRITDVDEIEQYEEYLQSFSKNFRDIFSVKSIKNVPTQSVNVADVDTGHERNIIERHYNKAAYADASPKYGEDGQYHNDNAADAYTATDVSTDAVTYVGTDADAGTVDMPLAQVTGPIFAARVTVAVLSLIESKVINPYSRHHIVIKAIAHTCPKAILLGIYNAFELMLHLGRMMNPAIELANVELELVMSDGSVQGYYLNAATMKLEKLNEIGSVEPSITIIEQMNRRIGIFEPVDNINIKGRLLYIYSSYGEDSHHVVNVLSKPLKYNISEENFTDVEYFLQNIFLKEHFRPKQFDIVKAALNRKNVIGLLPTGSGKTITFQLPALLQPAITMIISPLVSLMFDQVYNLNRVKISRCATVNGMLQGGEKRLLMAGIEKSAYQLVYVSPERLQIKEFKAMLGRLSIAGVVMDEAHCVSQWGHDFRTSYLRVGQCISEHFPNSITMALTGTASCNVITDIKRELNMRRNVEVVTPTSFRRPELHFKILEMDKDNDLKDRIGDGQIEAALGKMESLFLKRWPNKSASRLKANNSALPEADEFYYKKDDIYVNTGIVFCPYATRKNASVGTIAARLQKSYESRGIMVGRYHGQCSNREKEVAQNSFIKGDTAILVSTKAFGMGIDKPNIRFTVHTCIPESIEAFYQEAGRAGRDGNAALNIIMAPPLTMDYDKINDKHIYEYFFTLNFPEQEQFKRNILEFLETGYMSEITFEKSIMSVFDCTDVGDGDVEIRLDPQDNHVKVGIKTGSGVEKYGISIANDGKPDIVPANPQKAIHENIAYNIYEKFIISAVKDDLQQRKGVKNETIDANFNLQKVVQEPTLAEMLKLPDFIGKYCYIGLDGETLENPVTGFIRYLLHETGKDYVKMTMKMVNQLNVKSGILKNAKNRDKRQLLLFLPIYNEVRVYNGCEPLKENNFFDLYDHINDRLLDQITGMQEKALYYLGILGVYDKYERCYSPSYIKIRLAAITRESLKEHIRTYISGYETRDYMNRRLGGLKSLDNYHDDDILGLLLEALNYIIDYAYEKIKIFRHRQAETMYRCMQQNDDDDEDVFMEEVYQYFESKYAEQLVEDIGHENLRLIDKWIKRVNDDSIKAGGNIRENLSHLRTSALKAIEARPQAFTPYFLYAYSVMSDPDMEIKTGIDYYLMGIRTVKKNRVNYRASAQRLCNLIMKQAEPYYITEVNRILDISYTAKEDVEDLLEMNMAVKGVLRSLQL